MQELISRVEDLAGIEMNHTTSLVVIFGIIFLTAVVVHIILHWIVLRAFENAPSPVPACGCKLLPRIIIPSSGFYAARHHCQYSGRALATKRQ